MQIQRIWLLAAAGFGPRSASLDQFRRVTGQRRAGARHGRRRATPVGRPAWASRSPVVPAFRAVRARGSHSTQAAGVLPGGGVTGWPPRATHGGCARSGMRASPKASRRSRAVPTGPGAVVRTGRRTGSPARPRPAHLGINPRDCRSAGRRCLRRRRRAPDRPWSSASAPRSASDGGRHPAGPSGCAPASPVRRPVSPAGSAGSPSMLTSATLRQPELIGPRSG